MKALLFAALLLGCSAQVEPAPIQDIPDACTVQSDEVRDKLCPGFELVAMCPTETHNFDAMHCTGVARYQITGNGWCCDYRDYSSQH